jgi:two-component sensor histidine kinase
VIDSLVLRLCDALPDVVFLLDREGMVRTANRHAVRLIGLPAAQIIGRPMLDLVDGEPASARSYLARCAGSGSPLPGALVLRTPSDPAALQVRGAALRTDNGTVFILLRCIQKPKATELFLELNARLSRLSDELHRRNRLQTELLRRLNEREVLLKEVHHRVRNNLQVIASFINLLAREAGSAAAREVLREVQARVRALGLIHGQLYAQDDLAAVDLGRLLPALCAGLAAIYGVAPTRVRFAIDVPPWSVELGPAVPIALLITEAVTNALKHAFPAGQPGTVRVELAERGGARLLRIADDGVCWPAAGHASAKSALGIRLMEALAEQVEGELEVRCTTGVEVRLALPAERTGRRG